MKLPKKPNKVSWAIGTNLYQVRLFSQDDCPSEIHKQDQSSMVEYLTSHGQPPSFDGTCNSNPCQDEQPSSSSSSSIPMVHWNGPPKFSLDSNWRVAAGDESKEVMEQTSREMGVPEAIYPCLSAIPSDPCVSFLVEEEQCSDSLTPIIPIISREEEATPLPVAVPNQPHHQHNPVVRPDYITAASAAVTAIVKIQQSGSLIDTDLLVKIFSDPNIFKKLLSNNSMAPDDKPSHNEPTTSPSACLKRPFSEPSSLLPLPTMGQPQPSVTRVASNSSSPSWVPSNMTTVLSSPISSSSPSATTAKAARKNSFSDINHVKNLIKKHGSVPDSSLNYVKHLIKEHGSGEAKVTNPKGILNVKQALNVKQNEADSKSQRPCTYFKTPRGCRNGSGCPFQHDSPIPLELKVAPSSLPLPAAKRSKLRAGIASSGGRIVLF